MRRFFTRTGCLAAVAMFAAMMAAPAQAAPAARTCATPPAVQTGSTETGTPPSIRSVQAGSAETGASSPVAATEPVYFTMTTAGSREPFVIKLTDPKKIEHARRVISGQETSRTHVMGKVIKRPAPYNPAYGFHLDPNTIDFFEMAIEVCDATLSYVEEHLDEACGAFLPGCFFCPWSSRIVSEVPVP